MQSRKAAVLIFCLVLISSDFLLPVMCGGKGGYGGGIELLLAAGMLAKLLRHRGGHKHHSHHVPIPIPIPHHGHHHGGGSGSRTVEVVHVPPPQHGYGAQYPMEMSSSHQMPYPNPSAYMSSPVDASGYGSSVSTSGYASFPIGGMGYAPQPMSNAYPH